MIHEGHFEANLVLFGSMLRFMLAHRGVFPSSGSSDAHIRKHPGWFPDIIAASDQGSSGV